jgi:hypothetical protein
MDSRLRFRPHTFDDERPGDPGTKRLRSCGLTVYGPRSDCLNPRPKDEVRGQPQSKSRGVGGQEKPGRESLVCPYRKPTQVGEASSLR